MAIRIRHIPKTSPSSAALSLAINPLVPSKRLRLQGSQWRGRTNDVLINWGSSEPIQGIRANIINKPQAVALASNKLATFETLADSDINIPKYVHLNSSVLELNLFRIATFFFAQPSQDTYLFRTTATSSGGDGIYVMDSLAALVESMVDDFGGTSQDYFLFLHKLVETSPYWADILSRTKFVSSYFNAKDEYRVHVFCGQAIHVQRKGLRTDDQRPDTPSFYIRNHANGFVFQVSDVNPPDSVIQASVNSVNALGLHFGAVDIRYNPQRNEYCVLEVNTAPALQGTTLERYRDSFVNLHKVLNT
jgi:hypothetical protein